MDPKAEKYPVQAMLTPFQVIQLTCGSFLPLLFWVFPRIMVNASQLDAQWSVGLLVAAGFVIAWVQGRLNHRFPEDTGIDYLAIVFGKWIGKGIGVLYVLVYIFFVAVGIRMFVFLVGALYMPNTPPFVLIILFLAVSVYGARLGVQTLARISAIFNPPVTLGLLLTFLTALFEYTPFGLFHHIDNWFNVFNGAYETMPMLFGFNFFQMLSPYYKKTKRSFWYPVISMVMNGLLIMVGLLTIVTMLGWELVQRIQWSFPFLFREIYLEGFIIERVGVSMIIISVVFNVVFTSNHLWGLATSWARLFNLPRDHFRLFVLPTAVIIGLIAWAFNLERTMEEVVTVYLAPVSWVTLLGIPICTLMLAVIRKKGQPGPPKESQQAADKNKNGQTVSS
ncbi:GerAB/ArcD/ProY family transporter [Pullulanibacillus sp. KACC 23026]|uniref:GerAB/ArcD/ProY family transporter n=1 Tax=Pullulanibacillus sp. KACC 23026 TaxID=3028315 RepID=UPI0023B0CC78|nr:GerAB/ArcD/ProY family transporter [Pullulanibacillus sp. KACC 23026]WEG14373.1 GerAB/ArcD/ProY family transporter [Pullulanibacillus sp. KACC 23026]